MMATTHAYIGLAAAVASLSVTARYAPATSVLLAAFVGGLVPDLDLVTSHRKTLHFPVLYPVAACVLFGLFAVFGGQAVFVFGVALASAGLHSLSDILGGGVGSKPWEQSSSKAVYNHVIGRWHRPRRLVRYSGAPEDFALCAAVAIPVVLLPSLGSAFRAPLIAILVGSGLYAVSRRRLPTIAASLRAVLPSTVVYRLPQIRFEDG
jgi:hypothetical protein